MQRVNKVLTEKWGFFFYIFFQISMRREAKLYLEIERLGGQMEVLLFDYILHFPNYNY